MEICESHVPFKSRINWIHRRGHQPLVHPFILLYIMVLDVEMIPESSYIVASQNLLASRLGDEVVILSLQGGKYYGLNPLAAFVWNLLSDPVRFSDLQMAVLEEYDVTAEQCAQDLGRLLQDLQNEGLIQISANGEANLPE